jgi:hypothetical protein
VIEVVLLNSFRVLFIGFAFLSISSLVTGNVLGQVDEGTAIVTVFKAQNDLISSYEAVLKAENVGVNVEDLLARLNVAAESLADANMSLRNGNFSGAVYFAGLASGGLAELQNEAIELTHSSSIEKGQQLFWRVTGSIFGGFFVLLLSFFGWNFVKEKYIRRLLKMKPEVHEVDEHR